MIVWVNGTFGVGKTATSREVCSLLPDARIFDTEHVGYMLRHVLASVPVDDFQDWREVIAARIEADTIEAGARQWRHDHLDAYESARVWLAREAEVIETAAVPAAEVAGEIVARVELAHR